MEFKLSYFDGKGRGEIIRMIFAVAGVNFEDERLSGEKWEEAKEKTPLKSMPVLSTPGRPMVCQTGAIARYLAKKYGFFGDNPWEELLIDECVETVADVVLALAKHFVEKDEDKKAEIMKKFLEENVPKFVSYIRLRMAEGKNGYIIGSRLSLADLSVFNIIDQLKGFGITAFDSCDDIMKHFELVKSNPNLTVWLEKRPK